MLEKEVKTWAADVRGTTLEIVTRQAEHEELAGALEGLELCAQTVEVHASLRSFSPRVNAVSMLEAFSSRSITAVLPAFSHVFEVRPPIDVQLEANGYVYGEPTQCGSAPVYRQQHADIDPDMGVLPRAAVDHGALRGNHPFNGFCAVGPEAADVVAAQTPDATYGPVAAAAERHGKLLLIGVGLNRATCLHHAESLAGRRQFTRWYCDGGAMHSARTGGCSAAFDAFIPFITAPRQHVMRGSTWSVFDIATLVEEVSTAIAVDPSLGLCSSHTCHKCPSARARIS